MLGMSHTEAGGNRALRLGRPREVNEFYVPGSLQRIRQEMSVEPTPRNKWLTLTVRITAYDSGMIQVDGVPINVAPRYDGGHGWLGAAEMVIVTMSEFRRQTEKRQRERSEAAGSE